MHHGMKSNGSRDYIGYLLVDYVYPAQAGRLVELALIMNNETNRQSNKLYTDQQRARAKVYCIQLNDATDVSDNYIKGTP